MRRRIHVCHMRRRIHVRVQYILITVTQRGREGGWVRGRGAEGGETRKLLI
jgi:hypothetical protein